MTKRQTRPKWRMNLSASNENVRFSVQGHLGRRAVWTLVAVGVIVLCALIAPEVVAEIARLLKTIFP
ncbi:MAG TPA: hypothetical protein VJG32_12755 [Anaerolineae bacterium]|nr:hypothetical protein [Anaerolineae bacterium]